MDNLSHNTKVLVMTLSELAFVVPAIPLYIFLVLPNHPEGTLPGILPLIGGARHLCHNGNHGMLVLQALRQHALLKPRDDRHGRRVLPA